MEYFKTLYSIIFDPAVEEKISFSYQTQNSLSKHSYLIRYKIKLLAFNTF